MPLAEDGGRDARAQLEVGERLCEGGHIIRHDHVPEGHRRERRNHRIVEGAQEREARLWVEDARGDGAEDEKHGV